MIVRLLLIGSLLLCAAMGAVGYVYYSELQKEQAKPEDAAAKLLAKLEAEPPGFGESSGKPVIEDFQGVRWPIVEGEPFPDLTFTDMEGKEVKLSQFKGKPIFVEAAAMSCGASVAFSGGQHAGPYKGVTAQAGLPGLEMLVRMATNGFTFDDPRIVAVQILFFNTEMQTPTPADLVAWRDHFRKSRKVEPMILAAPKGLPSGSTMPLVPGIYLVDRDFKVRYSHTGSSSDTEKLINLFRALPRMADAPPTDLPKPSDELVEKVAKAFLANQNPKLPFGPELVTNASRRSEIEAARKRVFQDLYHDDAPGAEKWNDDALKCIDQVSKSAFSVDEIPTEYSLEEANAAGKRAVDAGCTHPMLLRSYATSMTEKNATKAIKYGRQALEAMQHGNYPPEAIFRVNLMLARKLQKKEKGKIPPSSELRQASMDCIPLYAKAMAQPNLTPDQQELLLEPIFIELGSGGLLNSSIWQFHDAVVKEPGVDPWVVDVISGLCHLEEAWRQRGSGLARTVTQEGFAGFDEHCKASAACFASAWSRRPENPIPARHMVRVMLSGQSIANESMRFWFNQAVTARFDDMRSYRALMWSLRPRWGGSHEEMLQFGKECLDTKRFDTLVPYVFANAVLDCASEMEHEDRVRLFASPRIAESLQQLYTGMLADPSWDDKMRKALHTEFAMVAYLADRMDICREQYKMIVGEIDPSIFQRFPVNPAAFQQALGTVL